MVRWVWFVACCSLALAQVGQRPYEMVWADRTTDDHPPLVDFEDLRGWTVETQSAIASIERSREQLIWGDSVGKLTYRADGTAPSVMVRPPQPIPIARPFDAFSLWIYGNTWSYNRDPSTPPTTVTLHLLAADGTDIPLRATSIRWVTWHLAYRLLAPEDQVRLAAGASFNGLELTGGRNTEDRVLYFDNLAFFVDEMEPLEFAPRRRRGIDMFADHDPAINTGEGRLPFPTRPETILPTNLTAGAQSTVSADGESFTFRYQGADGRLLYRLTPQTGTLGDVVAQWQDSPPFRPMVGGGTRWNGLPNSDSNAVRHEHLGTALEGDSVVSRWRETFGERAVAVSYTYRLWGKSLVIDVAAPGGEVEQVVFGRAEGLAPIRLVTLPYYANTPARPAVAVARAGEQTLFVMGNVDWYQSNGSELFAENSTREAGIVYNGGTRYLPLTNGNRNDVYERLFLTVSPRFEEVLPNIPNPVSPYKPITGTRLWRAHGASDRERDAAHWRKIHRYGLTELVVTDHETGWRDSGESFTYRTRPAPGKGGDEGQFEYARIMQDELGFVYGPYNNFTDFAPVNEFWSPDLIARNSDGQLREAWARCYNPKALRAVEYCDLLAPLIEAKFGFSTAYCDVHTVAPPWRWTDYDARVPGAGTFAATYYSYGEIMLLQKQAWDGPVYSEGSAHCYYSGLTDGNYAQDRYYDLDANPWLVDFDLRKIHPLECNFGMGNLGMFYGRDASLGQTRQEIDRSIDRFLAATIAFGHPGFLTLDGGLHNGLRSYYMLQQLAADYTQVEVESIGYAGEDGLLHDTSEALVNGAYLRSQIVNRYQNGTVTVVNGNRDHRLRTELDGRRLDLPPMGYAGWTADGQTWVFAGDVDEHRVDYAATPAYVYIDGRGRFTRLPRAAANGIAVCRRLSGGLFEIIAYEGAEAGFHLGAGAATAVALDEAGDELGPAEVRVSRGLTYLQPVDGAFSYRVSPAADRPVALTAPRDRVVPGETVVIGGRAAHEFRVPPETAPGTRLWQQFEGAWIDFTVLPVADVESELSARTLTVQLRPNLPGPADAIVRFGQQSHPIALVPGETRTLTFALPLPRRESLQEIALEIDAPPYRSRHEWLLRTVLETVELVPFPRTFTPGMQLRGQPETSSPQAMAAARASVTGADEATAGNLQRQSGASGMILAIHPPYNGGVGSAFALFGEIELPAEPAAAFRAWVGKGDGSDLGDGILYRAVLIDAAGGATEVGRQTVRKHEWLELAADLAPWAGQTIQLKLIADVGEGDNSSGDWAKIAWPRIESREAQPSRTLQTPGSRYATATGPFSLDDLTVADLRGAAAGRIHYDGANFAGTGKYGSKGVLNGLEMGWMTSAGGDPGRGIWAEDAVYEIDPAAIPALGARNLFRVLNPGHGWYKLRNVWLELDLADGRTASSRITTTPITQPPNWPYAEGLGVPFSEEIQFELWFDLTE